VQGVALLAGSMLVLYGLHIVSPLKGLHWTLTIIGAMAVLCALVSLPVLPIYFVGSPWRVPQTWGQYGFWLYSALFGTALGTGILTALPSPGFYIILLTSFGSNDATLVIIISSAFAFGRWVTIMVSALAIGRYANRLWIVDSATAVLNHARWPEGALLALLGFLMLFNSLSSL
jgi:hypothetical protein